MAYLGLICCSRRDYATGLRYLRHAIALDPSNKSLYIPAARAANALQNANEALAIMESAVQRWPEDAAHRKALGNYLQRVGRFPEARLQYAQVAARTPDDPDVNLALARLDAVCGHFPQSLVRYSRERARSGHLPSGTHIIRQVAEQNIARSTSHDRCTVTLLAGESLAVNPDLSTYLRSVRANVHADHHIIVADLSAEAQAHLCSLGFHITCVPRLNNILHNRWLCYYAFVAHSSYTLYAITDCRDVVFQRDPFDELPSGSMALILSSEGWSHGASHWNTADQCRYRASQGLAPGNPEWEVLNGGVHVGTRDALSQLSLALAVSLFCGHPDATDQAALNYICHSFLSFDPRYSVRSPLESAFCATGATIGALLNSGHALWDGGRLQHRTLGDYAIIHQWDRTPFAAAIRERWASDAL
jgi:hypothetical protein